MVNRKTKQERPLYIGWEAAQRAAKKVAKILRTVNHTRVYPISEDGYMAIYLLKQYAHLDFVGSLKTADTVVTGIVDTDKTIRQFSGKLRVALFAKEKNKQYCGIVGTVLKTQRHIVLPWEDLDEWRNK